MWLLSICSRRDFYFHYIVLGQFSKLNTSRSILEYVMSNLNSTLLYYVYNNSGSDFSRLKINAAA